MPAGDDLVVHLARFARALRDHGIQVGIGDEIDATRALTLIDLFDRAEVQRAFQIAFKIRPPDREAFDALFQTYWSLARDDRARRQLAERPMATAALPRGTVSRDEDHPADQDHSPHRPTDSSTVGYTRDVVLRRKPFEECSPRDLAEMERLLTRLAPSWAARRSRRLKPVRGRGLADLRRSFRRAIGTGGEMLSLAHRARAIADPRVVVLCDTSGSMDVHVKFLLAFILALKRVARRTEVFAFNTSLVRLTPWLSPGKIGHTVERLAIDVPGWSGGTRIGESLSAFVEQYQQQYVTDRSVVVILSDGLDRGDTTLVSGAMRALAAKARKIVWLNPLAGDARYEPTARAMQAALPFIDRLAPAHNLESLERLVPELAA
ncbi:MAG: vWA domain-containing protein [Acidobacteriota bacterium]